MPWENKTDNELLNSNTIEELIQSVLLRRMMTIDKFKEFLDSINLVEIRTRIINGQTSESFKESSPISKCFPSNKEGEPIAKELILLLLSYGADINSYGLDRKTLINNSVKQSIDFLFFILSKGANPNMYENSISLLLPKNPRVITNINIQKIELFIMFGCIPLLSDTNKLTNITKQEKRERVLLATSLNVDEMLEKCSQPFLIKKLANAFNITEEDDEKVCDCVKFIIQNRDQIDYDDIRNSRREKLKSCKNTKILSEISLDEINDEDIYKYNDFCFHVSELDNLIVNKKNPYTNEEIEDEDILDMVDKLDKSKVPHILEDILNNFDKPPTEPTVINDEQQLPDDEQQMVNYVLENDNKDSINELIRIFLEKFHNSSKQEAIRKYIRSNRAFGMMLMKYQPPVVKTYDPIFKDIKILKIDEVLQKYISTLQYYLSPFNPYINLMKDLYELSVEEIWYIGLILWNEIYRKGDGMFLSNNYNGNYNSISLIYCMNFGNKDTILLPFVDYILKIIENNILSSVIISFIFYDVINSPNREYNRETYLNEFVQYCGRLV
jgi:hypothetical protein